MKLICFSYADNKLSHKLVPGTRRGGERCLVAQIAVISIWCCASKASHILPKSPCNLGFLSNFWMANVLNLAAVEWIIIFILGGQKFGDLQMREPTNRLTVISQACPETCPFAAEMADPSMFLGGMGRLCIKHLQLTSRYQSMYR